MEGAPVRQITREPQGRLGGTVTATGGETWRTLCRMENDGRSYAGTIYTSAGPIVQPTGGGFPVANPRVVVRVRIGGGNRAGNTSIYRYTLAGIPMSFEGTDVEVGVLIAPNEFADFGPPADATPFPVTVQSECAGFIAIGSNAGEDLAQTAWHEPASPLAASEVVQIGPGRIHQIQGFNHDANLAYLMFFDATAVPANGTVPLFTIPVPGGDTTFSNDFIKSTRVFMYGLVWAVSTTPDTLTQSAAVMRVDVELYQQTQRAE